MKLFHHLSQGFPVILFLFIAIVVTACAKHSDCIKADVFGHCNQWKNQQKTCENPDFLGFCPGK